MTSRVTLACVIEDAPRLRVELVLWVICVKTHLPRERFRPVVYFVGTSPPDLREWVEAQGIETRDAEPAIQGAPHCSKIIPFGDGTPDNLVAVCDIDLYFVDDPTPLIARDHIQAAPNNHGMPPLSIWHRVLGADPSLRAYRPGVALMSGATPGSLRETHINNISAGFVICPADLAVVLHENWLRRARWLFVRKELLDRFHVHIDQVSFALAMEDIGADVRHLPPQTNIVLELLDQLDTPYAFHLTTGHVPKFAERFMPDCTLARVGLSPGMSAGIDRLNDCIRQAMPVIVSLPSTREHVATFLNPAWRR